jgi:uncharacterized protein YbbK (DUF523 family)
MPAAGPGESAMDKPHILVSACLLGRPCRYDGAAKPRPRVQALAQAAILVPVCPECDGGLPVPRPPAEIQPDGTVVNALGRDVTAAYRLGAQKAVAAARANGCRLAVLKARSPACGAFQTYDGTFTHTLTDRPGIVAAALRGAGVAVYDEEGLPDLEQSK